MNTFEPKLPPVVIGYLLLVVLGTRGRGEFLGAMLGSVSQGILHRAKAPVAVIGSGDGGSET